MPIWEFFKFSFSIFQFYPDKDTSPKDLSGDGEFRPEPKGMLSKYTSVFYLNIHAGNCLVIYVHVRVLFLDKEVLPFSMLLRMVQISWAQAVFVLQQSK